MTQLIRHFFVAVILLIPCSFWANQYLDSLKSVANGKIEVPKANRVQAMLELSKFSWASEADSALSLTNKALELAQELGNPSLIADAWFDLGMIAYINGSFKNGLGNFEESANSYKEAGEKFKEANSYYQGGLCLKELKEHNEAVEWFEKTKGMLPEEEYYQLTFSVVRELGECYHMIGDTTKAENNYKAAINISEFHEDTSSIILSHIELGVYYGLTSKSNGAITEFNEAIKLTSPSNKQLLSQLYNHLGETYILKNDLDQALQHFNLALALANESNSEVALAKTHFNLSKVYEIQQKFALALIEYKLYTSLHDTINKLSTKDISSLQAKFDNVTKEQQIKMKELEIAQVEAESDEKLRNEAFKRNVMIGGIVVVGLFGFLLLLAFRRQKKANHKLDQLGMVAREIENTVIVTDGDGKVEWINESYRRKYGLTLEQFKEKYGENIFDNVPSEDFGEKVEICKKEKKTVQFYISNKDKDGLDRHMKSTLTPRLDEDGEIVNYILIDTEITDLIIAEKQVTKQRDKLSRLYDQVSESIDYAKRIQEAVLPHSSKVSKFFSDYYLQYLPKDGVSGDFYFIEATDDYIYLAGADCTGHGVPGALMSVICYNLLENAVHRYQETDEILAELNHQLIRKLRQSTDDSEHIKDGLDIALVRLTKGKEKLEMQYSGAHSPVYLVANGELKALKPSKIHLGQNEISPDAIKKESVVIEEEQELVFFSDGFPDQKGGPRSKKFYYPPFRELISTINQLPQEEKLKHLNKVFNKWKIGKDQTDDVLVWGLKIKP
jgi:PAS domain S-box-containing protein